MASVEGVPYGSAGDLVSAGYGGYAGWGDLEALYDFRATGGSGKQTQKPQSASQVTPYLNNYQQSQLAVPTPEEIKKEVVPATPPPAPISRVEEFNKLRTQYGVPEMEAYLNDLKTQEEFLYSELRARTGAERRKPVPLGVIAGRISEEERQQNERIDVVTRLKTTVQNQLNTAYSIISTYVNYLGADYQDAVDSYNNEFQRNMSIYGLISEARQEIKGDIRYAEETAREERRYQQQVASANLQTMMNAITSGNVRYDQLSDGEKLLISQLEAQAGLPVGFTASMKINPKDTVLFQTSNEGITQVGFMQPDGTVRVEKYGTRISSGGSDKLTTEDYKDYLISDVQGYKNLGQVLSLYSPYLDDKDIIRLYDRNSPFGVHKESDDELRRKYGVTL